MKLRILENSLRLRLTRNEVARLHESGIVECAIHFPGARTLAYSVACESDITAFSASYDGDSIRIRVPQQAVAAWAGSHDIAMEGISSDVSILIEKDFQCLHQAVERDPDAYPNPLA